MSLTGKQVVKLVLENREAEAVSLAFEQKGNMTEAKELVNQLSKSLQHLKTEAAILDEVLAYLENNQKIMTVKIAIERKRIGLKQAKEFVDEIENIFYKDLMPAQENPKIPPFENEVLLAQVKALLQKGNKIEAVKLVKENSDWGLKESKDFVDEIERKFF